MVSGYIVNNKVEVLVACQWIVEVLEAYQGIEIISVIILNPITIIEDSMIIIRTSMHYDANSSARVT